MKKIIYTIALMIFTVSSYAQVKVSGEFRPRTEYSHGYKSPAVKDQDASTFTSQRTRLNFDYKKGKVITRLVLQDVRVWGSQPQLVSNEEKGVSIHEAWAELFLAPEFSLKAGRMELIYDDHRIFGSVGWAHQARSHDLMLLKYQMEKTKFHLGIAYNENTQRNNDFYAGPNAYKAMQYAWFNHNFGKFKLSLLALNNGLHSVELNTDGTTIKDEKIRYSQTIGGRGIYPIGEGAVFSSNLYYQMGKNRANKDLSAYNVNLDVLFKLTPKFKLSVGYEILSGTDYNETEDDMSFTPFYGTNHKFNGHMDYFYVGNHGGSVGLHDIYLKSSYKVNKKVGVGAHLHFYNSDAKVGSDQDKYLGTEIDLSVSYKVSDMASISCGYSHMIASDAMETLKGVTDADGMNNWAYLMLTVKPVFFKK